MGDALVRIVARLLVDAFHVYVGHSMSLRLSPLRKLLQSLVATGRLQAGQASQVVYRGSAVLAMNEWDAARLKAQVLNENRLAEQ